MQPRARRLLWGRKELKELKLGGLRNSRRWWLSSEHATPVASWKAWGWGCRCKPHPPKWLLEALRLHPNKTGHRRPPPECSAAASSFSRSRLFRVACRGAHSALACGCCWRVAVSDVVFVFSVELNFRLLGVFLCGWQPADSQVTRPAEESVVIPSVVVFTSEVLT